MREDQTSVNEWALNTFGDCELSAAIKRMDQEYIEFMKTVIYMVPGVDECGAPTLEMNGGALGDELADILICMYRVAQKAGVDLQAHVDMKMTINRRRKWKSNGDGTGQHIPE